MIDTKLARENPVTAAASAKGGVGADGQPSPLAPVGVSTGIVNQLTRWIPSESILLYVALLATFTTLTPQGTQKIYQLDFRSRWIALWAFVVVTELLVIGLSYGKATRNHKTFKWPVFELLVAPIAFIAWAVALPDTPLLDYKGYNNALGAFVLLAVTVGISVAAYIFNQSPDYETVVTS
jgi:hypothetical protein